MVMAPVPEGSNKINGNRKSKLATRFRNISILLIALILFVTVIVSAILIIDFTDTASFDYVRFYTAESVEIFSSHVNRGLIMVQHISQSGKIIEWFADEENEVKKAAALQEMIPYAEMLQISRLHFAVAGSLNEYFLERDTIVDEIKPYDVLNSSSLYDQWFFSTISSLSDYTLRVDACKVNDDYRLWISHRVVKDGVTVGVISSAMSVDALYFDLFDNYDTKNVKGYIIDHRGIIQIDSSLPNMGHFNGSYVGRETHISDINDYNAFISALSRYQRHPGIFIGRQEPEVIRLSVGDYRYLSIAPVPNTNWLMITFFSSDAVFNIMRVFPTLVVIVLAFTLVVALNSILIRRMLFKPLGELSISVSSSGSDNIDIYGVDRDDEIGELARNTQEVWSRLNDMALSLKESAEEAKAASLSKSSFLAQMSHEIRTPMNSIVGFSELALDNDLPPKVEDYLKNIMSNSEWLLQIINNILDITKIESGKIELENIPFDLGGLFNSCRAIILPKAMDKGLTMFFYAEPSIGKKTYGDPTRLRQVLVNLLSNAVKFTNTGMIKMRSFVKDVKDDSVSMTFEIMDSGIGIAPEQIEKIFEQFTQAESGTTRKFGGSGLGLTITKNLVELMGGTLHIESTPGVGSKFSFDLTFDAVDEEGAKELAGKVIFNELEKPEFEGEVLLCEDNVMNQQVICEHLARVGLKTVIAQNGQIGVDLIKNRINEGRDLFDLIFMDMHMPVMDGLEATAIINKLNTGIPIIAMTANIMTEDRDIYEKYGMSGFVGKPFTSQELWRCLMGYFKPHSWQSEEKIHQKQADEELQRKLVRRFIETNENKYHEIIESLSSGNIELAHRLAHTLKSNAGQLGKVILQRAAGVVEAQLKNGENLVTPEQMLNLKTELNAVLIAITPFASADPLSDPDAEMLDPESALDLLNELEPLLRDNDSDCVTYIPNLRGIKGSEDLIKHIDYFDFKPALESLSKLRDNLNKI